MNQPISANAKKYKASYYLKRDHNLYIMLIPGILFFFFFHYVPMAGILVAFKNYNVFRGFAASPWVGFKYFTKFFNDFYFSRLIRNTFLLSFFSLVFSFPLPIILALSFNEVENAHFKKITQTISYMPHFLSTVVIVGLLNQLTASDGLFNAIRKLFGAETIVYSVHPEWFRPLYISSGMWQGAGWGTIIYLASLSNVDPQLYEAATIDGAGRFAKMWHVSIPTILPVIVIQLILNCGGLLSVGFEKAYLMQNEAIYETADVISTYVYRRGMIKQEYGYSSAIGLFNSAVSICLTLTVNFIAGKLNDTTLL